MQHRIAIFIVVASWMVAAPSLGQERDEAAKMFDQGKKHFNEGAFVQAAGAFRKANELRPNWKLLFNIAQSEAAAKRYGLALEAFEEIHYNSFDFEETKSYINKK